MASKTYGRLYLQRGRWKLEAESHVLEKARLLFGRSVSGPVEMPDDPASCLELDWLMYRYPLAMDMTERNYLRDQAADAVSAFDDLEKIICGEIEPPEFLGMAKPPRGYQRIAAEVWLRRKELLLADSMGAGKTVSAATAMMSPLVLPATVVVLPALRDHWEEKLWEFAPHLNVKKITSGIVTPIASCGKIPDVMLVSYGMVPSWYKVLGEVSNSVIWDEVHELRREESQKYEGSLKLSRMVEYRMGMSGTPIINYGSELYNVMRIIAPKALGTRADFLSKWCMPGTGSNHVVKDPVKLNAYLRREQLMLRRTRKDIGRELPGLNRETIWVDGDQRVFNRAVQSAEFARVLKRVEDSGWGRTDKLALSNLDTKIREASGIAKAAKVAGFVEDLIEAGEKVVLFGWHRKVYAEWLRLLGKYDPAMFTGSESTATKWYELKRFSSGETPLLIMSNRSGVGVDGLQKCGCKTVVIGEYDWSPSFVNQCIERVYRDGQEDVVSAFFIASRLGSDARMIEVLRSKEDQHEGIICGGVSEAEVSRAKSGFLQEYARKLASRQRELRS